MRDPSLFGPWFVDESCAAWRALFVLPRTPAEADLFARCTGREHPPVAPASETWVVAGRRAGKSLISAALATYAATFRDYRPHLKPGERATVLSLFEPQTEAIRKGKAAKPTEFGEVVKIQEAEGGLITDYVVCPTRVPDQELWQPAVNRHHELFDRPPKLAVPDGGFASAANERAATDLGVDKVALPRTRGRPRPKAKSPPRQRWFRRALRWRTGCEGRISVLKRCHGLRRCRYRGPRGMERWVGLGVIANNLRALGRTGRRAGRKSDQR